MLAMGQGDTTYQIQNNDVAFRATRLPVDNQGRLQLNNFDFDSGTMISAMDILSGRTDLGQLRDKVVLIGATGSVTAQNYKTPLSGNRSYSSTQIQANLAETILSQHVLVEQDRLTQIVMILLLALLAGATLPHF
jgi:CHASE2 domain-containing sensor protein